MLNALAEGIAEGYTFNLLLFNTPFSISGVFDGPLDSFDPNRHRLHVNLRKGTTLHETEKKVRLEKTNTSSPVPQIQEVRDSVSRAVNERLTPGGMIEMRDYTLRKADDSGTTQIVGEQVAVWLYINSSTMHTKMGSTNPPHGTNSVNYSFSKQ